MTCVCVWWRVCVCVCVMVVWKCCPLQCLLDIWTRVTLLWKSQALFHCSSCQFCSNPWLIAGFSGLVTACWANFSGENNGYVETVAATAHRHHSKYVHFWTAAVDTLVGELTLPASAAAESVTARSYCAMSDTLCPIDTSFQRRLVKTTFGESLMGSYVTSERTVKASQWIFVMPIGLANCNPQLGDRGGPVIKVLCYKSEFCWFDSRWCHWNFSLT
jgi:hypothetical protein